MKQSYKILALFLLSLMLFGCLFGEDKTPKRPIAQTYKDWITVDVKGVGTFQIPPTMEVQTDEFRNAALKSANKLGSEAIIEAQKQRALASQLGSVICQQKGLNSEGVEGKASKNYARVVFSTIKVKDQKVPTYGHALGLKAEDIKSFGEITKEGIIANEKPLSMKYVKWEPMKSEIINGAECLVLSYDRQFKDNPIVHVDRYTFFDEDRIFVMEISSRVSEKDIWHAKDKDINDIVTTLSVRAKK